MDKEVVKKSKEINCCQYFLGEKTVTSNMSISNLENLNLENESWELSRELKDGVTQYQFQQFFEIDLT